MRVLFVPTYQEPRPRPGSSSDSIGYGITSSGALVHELCRLGCEVRVLTTDTDAPDCRETFAARVAAAVPSAVHTFRPDVIFLFHSFATPASLIRLALLDAKEPTPIIGYLHGSHWDPTDTYRSEAYPGLKWLDLANLMALDRAVVVTQAFRQTLLDALDELRSHGLPDLESRLVQVPLPIATRLIDSQRPHAVDKNDPPLRVVFNHAPIPAKNPVTFVRVMHELMTDYDLVAVFTRRFAPNSAGHADVTDLARRFPGRVELMNDPPADQYFAALWQTDLQVSTASHESLGVATLEAMYTGNCCVLPDLPAYRETTGNLREVLYRPGDTRDLIHTLRHFIDQPTARARARAHLTQQLHRYTPTAVAVDILTVFESVLGHG